MPTAAIRRNATQCSVSVIIPTYNRARFVCEAIDSALNQTLAPHEIIVIDDGSTDDTVAALRSYGSRIIVHCQSNRGVSAARNVGLSIATGEYVAFLDSDDLWKPFKLDLEVAILENLRDIDLLFTEFKIQQRDGTKLHHGSRRWLPKDREFSDLYPNSLPCETLHLDNFDLPPDASIYFGNVYHQMLHEHFGLTSTSILRRSAIDADCRFTDGVSLYEDWEFFARIAKAHNVAFVDIETTVNRSHPGPERLTHEPRLVKVQSYLGVLDRVWKADPQFVATQGSVLQHIEAGALLALARESTLVAEREIAKSALERWKNLDSLERIFEARLYWLCASIPGGGTLLRLILRFRTLIRVLAGTRPDHYSSSPAR